MGLSRRTVRSSEGHVEEPLGAATVQPAQAALIVVDLQNDYCSPLGAYGKAGTDLSMMPPVIERSGLLIEAARRAGVLVVWLQQTVLRGGLSAAPSALRSRDRYLARERCVDGTFGHAIVEPLAPRPDEPVIKKLRSSGFVGTMLDQVLDANGIRTCVLVGVGTEGCVEATARSAADHNYEPVVVEDCVASTRMDLHAYSLRVVRTFSHLAYAEQLTAWWNASPFAGERRPGMGRRVHESLNEILRPSHTAVVIAGGDAGLGVARTTERAIETLAVAARQAGVALVRLRRSGVPAAVEGHSEEEDLTVTTIRPDGFEGSPLHLLLDEREVHTVVLAGSETYREVESTARGAVHRNYHVVCVEDAMEARDPRLHDMALAIMRQRYDVITTGHLASVWAAAVVRAE